MDLKIGMTVLLNGCVPGIVEELGTPEDIRHWRDWKGDEAVYQELLDSCRRLELTRCASIGVDGEKKALLIAEQRGQWRVMIDGTPLEIEEQRIQ